MTVLPWLLLYATVIQLGQSNYSISSEDGTYEVNSYANNTLPFIDRSQIRRTRRSVDSDLEDAQKAFDNAEAARKIVEEDRQKADTTLRELEGNLTEAKKLVLEKEKVYNTAISAAESVTENNLREAIAAVKPAEDAYNAAETVFNNSMLAWKSKEETERIAAEEIYNKTEKDKKAADTALKTANNLASKMIELKGKYDTEQATKNKYNADIQLYEYNNKFVTTIATEKENIEKNHLQKNVDDAQKDNNDKEKDKNDIEKNDILNGNINEDFSVKTVKDVEYEKDNSIYKWDKELVKMPKDSTEFAALQKKIDQAKHEVKFVKDLLEIDPNFKDKKVKELQSNYNTMLDAAKTALATSSTNLKNAKDALAPAETKINKAQSELNKVDINALRTANEKAVGAMKQVNDNIKKYTEDLDDFATANGGKKGEAEWTKLKGVLDGDVTTKTTAVTTADEAMKNAQNEYTQTKKAAETKRESIKDKEEKDMNDKKKVKDDAVAAKNSAQIDKDGVKDYIETKEMEYKSAQDRVTKLEGEIVKARETLNAKKIDEENALNAEQKAKGVLEIAKQKKSVDEEKSKSGALGVSFSATAVILLIGVSVGFL